MKKWEDIVKDKLEGYESPLPEGSLADFHARREGAASTPPAKRFPWVWVVTTAVAAGVAALLFLRQPNTPGEGIHVIQQPSAPLATTVEQADENTAPAATTPLLAQASTPQAAPRKARQTAQQVPQTQPQAATEIAPSQEETSAITPSPKEEVPESPVPAEESVTPIPDLPASSPFVPMPAKRKPSLKVAPAAGGVLGAGALAALTSALITTKQSTTPGYIGHGYNYYNGSSTDSVPGGSGKDGKDGIADSSGGGSSNPPQDNPSTQNPPTEQYSNLLQDSQHYLPLKLGGSARVPLTEKLCLTSGLEYSLYASRYVMSASGDSWQRAHYLGIPLRVDWIITANSWLDVYVGAGAQADFCLGATLDKTAIRKDNPSLSLLGAGGIQINLTKRLGLYVEPALSWRIPTGENVLATYRSEHPLLFSVSTGLRINLGR